MFEVIQGEFPAKFSSLPPEQSLIQSASHGLIFTLWSFGWLNFSSVMPLTALRFTRPDRAKG
jgi:hypothetical protein